MNDASALLQVSYQLQHQTNYILLGPIAYWTVICSLEKTGEKMRSCSYIPHTEEVRVESEAIMW